MLPDPKTNIGWANPKLEKRESPTIGKGMFAKEPIAKGELLALWGGLVINAQERAHLPEPARHYTIQIDTHFHLTSSQWDNDADYFNHSCDPNAGLRGQIGLVAMRDIAAGEEVCFDYAMSESDPDYKLECICGLPRCRKIITGNDWKLPDLRARYEGYFSLYIEDMIHGDGQARNATP
ncbi:MAG TPA: SET domain-containing protein-lysine N-methyltransferase [Aggregatilineales bacterium]|nr:SET domain-containing protein-lysine N-methyltransferase [Aggregatilineales bacterium]